MANVWAKTALLVDLTISLVGNVTCTKTILVQRPADGEAGTGAYALVPMPRDAQEVNDLTMQIRRRYRVIESLREEIVDMKTRLEYLKRGDYINLSREQVNTMVNCLPREIETRRERIQVAIADNEASINKLEGLWQQGVGLASPDRSKEPRPRVTFASPIVAESCTTATPDTTADAVDHPPSIINEPRVPKDSLMNIEHNGSNVSTMVVLSLLILAEVGVMGIVFLFFRQSP